MRALTKISLGLGVLPALALAACAANAPVGGGERVAAYPPPGGAARWGTSIASMADLYNRPHAGVYTATGASSWVPPAPPPAYVDTSPGPPPVAEGPPPAAVRNRQPGASPAVAASSNEIPRPEAAAPTPAQAAATAPTTRPAPTARAQAVAASPADIARGRKLFGDMGCGGCHTLADAGAAGVVGPGFDGNRGLTPTYIFNTVHDGRNAMPSFAGQLSDADIRAIASYIIQVAKK